MNEFTRQVRSAAVAGWWTLLIATIFMAVQWLAYLIVMNAQPGWLISFWGGGKLQWSDIQTVWLWMAAVFKLCIWVVALVVIWLSFWARRLRRSEGQS